MKKIWLLLFVLLPVMGAGQVITTVAGNGTSTHAGDGGMATAALVPNPIASGAFDSYGNYYFCERFFHRIRKISPLGVINTFAGNGISGYSGDGGPATAAQLNNPNGVAVDKLNNVFIAENEGCRIRKIEAISGIIHTYAGNGAALDNGDGGPATAAAIYFTNSICFDRSGNLYFSNSNNKIRKVDLITGIISTYAGRGGAVGFSGDGSSADSAQLYGPYGICMDSLSNLFIADYFNVRIRKVDSSTHIITTFAGNGVGTYNGEGILATASQMNPAQLTFDNHGNLFIADEHNFRVRKIDATGRIFTVAGIGTIGFSGDGGSATAAQMFYPQGVSFDLCGNLYIPDNGNARIRKVTFNPPPCDYLNTEELQKETTLSIYPNPATTELTISAGGRIREVWAYDLLGQIIERRTGSGERAAQIRARSLESGERVRLDVSHFPSGVYFVKVMMEDGGVVVRRWVKE